jgi:hypothetical protein
MARSLERPLGPCLALPNYCVYGNGSAWVDFTQQIGTGSAALNIWTHAWTHPAMREESSLIETLYAAWADKNRLWKAEVEEGFPLDDLLEVLGELEVKALGEKIHGR